MKYIGCNFVIEVSYMFIAIVSGKKLLSEVGFEPTPRELDCDLNAAP